MKKLLSIGILATALIFGGANANAQRFGTSSSSDNTGRTLTYNHNAVTAASSVTVTPNASVTFEKVSALTSTMSVVVKTGLSKIDDELVFELSSDTASAGHVVTFSTGFSANTATITVSASKRTSVRFVFDGTAYVREGE